MTFAPDQPIGLTVREHKRLAAVLRKAAHERRPIAPLSGRYPEMTVADAGLIRDAWIAARIGTGERPAGARLTPCGVAWITSGMVMTGPRIAVDELIAPRIGAAIAVRLGRAANDGLLGAADRVLPAIEVVDSRYGDAAASATDALADNWGVTLVCAGAGAPPALSEELAFRLEVDGAVAARGTVTPIELLGPLLRTLACEEAGLQPGALLVAPVGAAPIGLEPGTRARVRWDRLGTVELEAVIADQEGRGT